MLDVHLFPSTESQFLTSDLRFPISDFRFVYSLLLTAYLLFTCDFLATMFTNLGAFLDDLGTKGTLSCKKAFVNLANGFIQLLFD